MENIQKLLCEMQGDFLCASKNTRTNAPSGCVTQNHSSARALQPKVRSAHGIICTYNWIADYTTIMLSRKFSK